MNKGKDAMLTLNLFIAINNEGDHNEFLCGWRLRAFASEQAAEDWINQQPDFGDWSVGKLEVPIEAITLTL